MRMTTTTTTIIIMIKITMIIPYITEMKLTRVDI